MLKKWVNDKEIEILLKKDNLDVISSPDDFKRFIDYPIKQRITVAMGPTIALFRIFVSAVSLTILLVSGITFIRRPLLALGMIKFLQSLDFFEFLNIEMPSVIEKVLFGFDFNILKMIPNAISIDESTIGCHIHPKLI